jgi:hypothetical protein
MRLPLTHKHNAPANTVYLRRLASAGLLLLLLFGVFLPASSAATKASSKPVVKIVSHPARVSYKSKATFIFFSTYYDVDAYLCSIDRHNFRSCTLVKTYRGLKTGKHRFAVKLVSDGVIGPVTAFAWMIKNRPVKPKPRPKPRVTAPTVTITSHPDLNTVSTTAALAFSSNKAKATFKCALDGSAATSCKSPNTYTGLAPGLHTFGVTASANGLSSPRASFSWYVSPVAPANTASPTITGTVQVGQVVTASNGTWSGSLPMTYKYRWQICSSGLLLVVGIPALPGPVSCGDIPGATSSSYTIQDWEVGLDAASSSVSAVEVGQTAIGSLTYTLRVVVTATNAGGQEEAVSDQTSAVLPAAPVNTSLPTISVSDPPTVGDYVSVSSIGTWTSYWDDIAYQWQRCDSSGNNCSDISGATSSSYLMQAADVGSELRVTITESNAGGSGSASSLPTAVVVS